MVALLFKVKQKILVCQTTLMTVLTLPLHSPVRVASGSLQAPGYLFDSLSIPKRVCLQHITVTAFIHSRRKGSAAILLYGDGRGLRNGNEVH